MTLPPLDVLTERLRAFRSPTISDESARAAVATILRDGENGPEILFIERAVRDGDPWSGDIAFPGGKRERADVSLRATAVRETLEEVGLVLPDPTFVIRLDDVVTHTSSYRVAQFVFVLTERIELTINPEVQSSFWIPLANVIAPELVENVSFTRSGFTFEAPCVRLGQHVLWGMTFRMTHALAEAMGVKESAAVGGRVEPS